VECGEDKDSGDSSNSSLTESSEVRRVRQALKEQMVLNTVMEQVQLHCFSCPVYKRLQYILDQAGHDLYSFIFDNEVDVSILKRLRNMMVGWYDLYMVSIGQLLDEGELLQHMHCEIKDLHSQVGRGNIAKEKWRRCNTMVQSANDRIRQNVHKLHRLADDYNCLLTDFQLFVRKKNIDLPFEFSIFPGVVNYERRYSIDHLYKDLRGTT